MPENVVSAVPPSFAERLFAHLLSLQGSVEIPDGDGRSVSFYSRDNRTFIYSVGPDDSERLHDGQGIDQPVLLARLRAQLGPHAEAPMEAEEDANGGPAAEAATVVPTDGQAVLSLARDTATDSRFAGPDPQEAVAALIASERARNLQDGLRHAVDLATDAALANLTPAREALIAALIDTIGEDGLRAPVPAGRLESADMLDALVALKRASVVRFESLRTAVKNAGVPNRTFDRLVDIHVGRARQLRRAASAARGRIELERTGDANADMHALARALAGIIKPARDNVPAGPPFMRRAGRVVWASAREVVPPDRRFDDQGNTRREHAGLPMNGGVVLVEAEPASFTKIVNSLVFLYEWKIDDNATRFKVSRPLSVDEAVAFLQGEWPEVLPSVRTVTGSPLIADDGTIVFTPGYHANFGVIIDNVCAVDVSDLPDANAGMRAIASLRGLLSTLDFKGRQARVVDGADCPLTDVSQPPSPSEAATLTLLLLAVARAALGLAPGVVVSAPDLSGSGSGKSMLIDLVHFIAFGHTFGAIPCQSGREQERNKRIDEALLAGGAVLALDNVNNTTFSDATVESLVTRRLTRLRVLGLSEAREIETGTLVTLNGNALHVGKDSIRRFLIITLDSGVERPSHRRFPFNPLKLVQADRGKYLSDCLTLIRWAAQGFTGETPEMTVRRTAGRREDSFEQAYRWCRDPVLSLTGVDAAEGQDEEYERDPARSEVGEIFLAWAQAYGESRVELKDIEADAVGGDGGLTMEDRIYTPTAEDRARTRLWSLLAASRDGNGTSSMAARRRVEGLKDTAEDGMRLVYHRGRNRRAGKWQLVGAEAALAAHRQGENPDE